MKTNKTILFVLSVSILFSCTKKKEFREFESHFPKVSLPFSVRNAKLVYRKNKKKEIFSRFENFIPGMKQSEFSRGVSDKYAYIASLSKTDKYTLVAYADENIESGEANGRDTFGTDLIILATYSHWGELIDTVCFACRDVPCRYMSGYIRPDLIIERQAILYNWKDHAYISHFNKKDLMSTQKIASYYRVGNNGRFVKLTEKPAPYKEEGSKLGYLR